MEVRAFPLVSSSFELHGSLVPENIELADLSFLCSQYMNWTDEKMDSWYIKACWRSHGVEDLLLNSTTSCFVAGRSRS